MESRFGCDFSQIRVHDDVNAANAARTVDARAFTVRQDILFGEGQYAPGTGKGMHLLAHELAHSIQQSSDSATGVSEVLTIQRSIGDAHDLQSVRFHGDPVLEACYDNERTLHVGNTGEAVAKVQQALEDLNFSLPEHGVDGVYGSETARAVREYQLSEGLVPDSVVGTKTIGRLDLAFAYPVPQVGRCTNPVVPRPPGKTDQQMITESDGAALLMTSDARYHLQRVRDMVAAGQMHKATTQDLVTLHDAQLWLNTHVSRRTEFLNTVDKALAVYHEFLTLNIQYRLIHGVDPSANCVGCNQATAIVDDPNCVINFCDLFFMRGPQCRRNVICHERLHLTGVRNHPRGNTPAAALDSTWNMLELIKGIMRQPYSACNAGI